MTGWAWFFVGTTVVAFALAEWTRRDWKKTLDLAQEYSEGWAETLNRWRASNAAYDALLDTVMKRLKDGAA